MNAQCRVRSAPPCYCDHAAQPLLEAASDVLHCDGAGRGHKGQQCRLAIVCAYLPLQEPNWKTPTSVCRILTAEGEDLEVQGTHDAMASLAKLKPGVAYSMTVPNTVIRPYTAGPRTSGFFARSCGIVASVVCRTGVKGKLTIRLAFHPASLQPALAGFDVDSLLDQEFVEPSQLMQAGGTGQVVNVAGEVLAVSAASSPGGGLVRRTVSLRSGDYEVGIEFLGALSEQAPPLQAKIVIYSCKVSTWMSIPVLESTRLSFWRAPSWLTVPESSEGLKRPKKALRVDIAAVPVSALASTPMEDYWRHKYTQ